MNVRLTQGQAGPGCGRAGYFMPRQIIKCSDSQGARWIEEGMASEAPAGAEIDGEFFDEAPEPEPPVRRGSPEKAIKPVAETPEGNEPAALCHGTTKLGNPCKRTAKPGSKFCQKHQE